MGGPNYTEWKEQQASSRNATENETAKDAKMAAVKKVIVLLEDIQAKVLEEGNKEAETYNTFACFCKDTMAEKTTSITDGKDEKTKLETNIAKLEEDREKLDEK